MNDAAELLLESPEPAIGDPRIRPAVESVPAWLTGDGHRKRIPTIALRVLQ